MKREGLFRSHSAKQAHYEVCSALEELACEDRRGLGLFSFHQSTSITCDAL